MEGGDVGRGLGTLAFVVDGTASKGGDFTSRLMNPRAWEEGTADLDEEYVKSARAWAKERDLDQVVRLALASSAS